MTRAVSSVLACLKGRCPRCHEGRIFATWLQLESACGHCGLDFSRHDHGDGPAYFTIFGLGGSITVLAVLTEYLYQPPYWLHAVLWLPMVLIGSVLMLHYCKAWMLAASYRHQRLEDTP